MVAIAFLLGSFWKNKNHQASIVAIPFLFVGSWNVSILLFVCYLHDNWENTTTTKQKKSQQLFILCFYFAFIHK
jgi:hypothetical protein